MHSPEYQQSVKLTAHILGRVRRKGVKLWSENGQLHYKAPRGALTEEDIEILRQSSGQIVALLERSPSVRSTPPPRGSFERPDLIPLTGPQLAHWNMNRLSERPAIRQIASAVQLSGLLRLDDLRNSLAEVVCRHEALRTRIVIRDGTPLQQLYEAGPTELEFEDLTGVPRAQREAEVQRWIEKTVMQPTDLATGPLWVARLLKLQQDEHVLVLAMEHLICDAYSMGVVLQELFAGYIQLVRGHELSLPRIDVQFPDYAVWQQQMRQSWLKEHGEYWRQRLTECQRVRFPEDRDASIEDQRGWGTIPLHIDNSLREQLREVSRARRTTVAIAVFTAYAALALRWSEVSDAVLQYETDGRASHTLESTIGYLASTLFLRIQLMDADSFADLINRVTVEYRSAQEHADLGYFAAQVPRPGFACNAAFNWIPQKTRTPPQDPQRRGDALTYAPVLFTHPMLKVDDRDNEPVLMLYDRDSCIDGAVHFPTSRFSFERMQRFAANFRRFLGVLASQSDVRIQDIVLN